MLARTSEAHFKIIQRNQKNLFREKGERGMRYEEWERVMGGMTLVQVHCYASMEI
jgi:hypothetical protein